MSQSATTPPPQMEEATTTAPPQDEPPGETVQEVQQQEQQHEEKQQQPSSPVTTTAAMEMTLEYSIESDLPGGLGLLSSPPDSTFVSSSLTLFREMYDSQLSEEREALWNVKTALDDVDEKAYYATRDTLFTLAHTGGDSRERISNRAGHKLKESMDSTGVWDYLVKNLKLEMQEIEDEKKRLAGEETEGDAAPAPEGGEAKKKKKKRGKPRVMAFADVCGGPGSFAQLLYNQAPRYHVKLRGYGLTLLDCLTKEAPQGWYPELSNKWGFIPCFGVDGKGDIYNTSNIIAFHTLVKDDPLRLVVADGGFEVDRHEANIQEAVSSRIVYSQWYVAVRILKPGGCFVLKLFDAFTPFTRSLFYLSTKFYERVHIVKPKHSRIVNSERYLVCIGLKKFTSRSSGDDDLAAKHQAWMNYLELVHREGFTNLQALNSLVPDEWMSGDAKFSRSNEACCRDIAVRQKKALQKLVDSEELQENIKRAAEMNARRKAYEESQANAQTQRAKREREDEEGA